MSRARSGLPDCPAIRPGTEADLAAVAEIQALSPSAAQWSVRQYLEYDFRVIEVEGRLAGFAVARRVAEEEWELLNLAVAPGFRRRGLGGRLLRDLCTRHTGVMYLEVRPSNTAALALYQAFGFQEVGRRPGYYEDPPEGAVVMKLRSCYCHN